MTVTAAPPEPQATAEPQYDGIVLEHVSWEAYDRLRDDLDQAGHRVWIVYDDGRMAIMAPLGLHDGEKKFIARMIEMMAFELDIPISCFGSTTWRRRDLRKGLEPDECYFVQHEPQIGGRRDPDPERDPPPDLVLEVEATRSPVPKFPIYAALGVPEIWHYDGKTIACLHLQKGGRYVPAEFSLAFPFLRPADLQRFLAMLPASRENDVLRLFRDWVRTLRPKG